jgi:hypothetical protein
MLDTIALLATQTQRVPAPEYPEPVPFPIPQILAPTEPELHESESMSAENGAPHLDNIA